MVPKSNKKVLCSKLRTMVPRRMIPQSKPLSLVNLIRANFHVNQANPTPIIQISKISQGEKNYSAYQMKITQLTLPTNENKTNKSSASSSYNTIA